MARESREEEQRLKLEFERCLEQAKTLFIKVDGNEKWLNKLRNKLYEIEIEYEERTKKLAIKKQSELNQPGSQFHNAV